MAAGLTDRLWIVESLVALWEDYEAEGGKRVSLRRVFGRWWALYQAAAFAALIPFSSYYVITHGLPKKTLMVCIPGYAVLSFASYQIFKNSK
jgi:hypothetical protein